MKGVPPGCLLEVVRSVYGLPDAPRAWWEEITAFLKEFGFTHCRMDTAIMIWFYEDGTVGVTIVIHVGDIMIANDGQPKTNKIVEKIHKRII